MGEYTEYIGVKRGQATLSEADFVVQSGASKKLNAAVCREENFWSKQAHSMWRANDDKCKSRIGAYFPI